MIEFGNTLRNAREAKGLTAAQIAENTHIMTSVIEALEREDFKRIPAPIYGRGFVKLYCEAVGIDPQPLIAEFMEIFNGNRETPILERRDTAAALQAPMPAAPEPTLPPSPAGEAAPSTDISAVADDLFAPRSAPRRVEPNVTVPPPPPAPEAPPQPPVGARTLSRFATPLPEKFRGPSIPASFWRFGVLGFSAAALLFVAGFCLLKLYRTTMPSDGVTPPEAPAAEVAPRAPSPSPAAEVAPRAPRKPRAIPPLYID